MAYSNGKYSGQSYTAPSSWSYTVPTSSSNSSSGSSDSGKQANTSGSWTASTGVSSDPSKWNTTNSNQWSSYMGTMLPYAQYQQNAYQYGNDFNEAQRRWNQQQGWTQSTDQFNMGLSGRQQQMAEWQANEAARQWQNQFDYTQQTDAFSQDLANRQFGLSQQTQDQNYSIASQANEINKAYNEGRLSNEARNIALGELTQQQNNKFAYDQMASQMGWNREELASTNAYRAQQDALAWAQMSQSAQMQTQSLEAQRQNAILQATGRNQMVNAKWMRR